jgi:hypothetical protein
VTYLRWHGLRASCRDHQTMKLQLMAVDLGKKIINVGWASPTARVLRVVTIHLQRQGLNAGLSTCSFAFGRCASGTA